MNSGLFLINKESGVSSAHVVGSIKKKFKLDKVGHAGTLDPFATGLLTILVGDATRLMDYFAGGDKIYSGILEFGIGTDSHDATGEVLARSDKYPKLSEVIEATKKMVGEIEQVPPEISAVHVNGKRAYDLARQGISFELKSKKITIKSIEIFQDSETTFKYRIHCSKGTYIRSIARDLGVDLEIPCIIKTLNRDFSKPFSLEEAKKIDQITIGDMLPWENFFPSESKIKLDDLKFAKLRNGNLDGLDLQSSSEFLVYSDSADQVGGLLKLENDKWKILFNCRR